MSRGILFSHKLIAHKYFPPLLHSTYARTIPRYLKFSSQPEYKTNLCTRIKFYKKIGSVYIRSFEKFFFIIVLRSCASWALT